MTLACWHIITIEKINIKLHLFYKFTRFAHKLEYSKLEYEIHIPFSPNKFHFQSSSAYSNSCIYMYNWLREAQALERYSLQLYYEEKLHLSTTPSQRRYSLIISRIFWLSELILTLFILLISVATGRTCQFVLTCTLDMLSIFKHCWVEMKRSIHLQVICMRLYCMSFPKWTEGHLPSLRFTRAPNVYIRLTICMLVSL